MKVKNDEDGKGRDIVLKRYLDVDELFTIFEVG